MEFIRGEYDRYDQWGKEILGSFLRGRGHEVVIRREDYGVDMFSHSINGAWRWEVEIKRSTKWSNMEDFPYMEAGELLVLPDIGGGSQQIDPVPLQRHLR
jgi:hypothetical protein